MSGDLARVLEQELRQRTMPGLSERLGDGPWLLPDYRGRSLANVPATVAVLLGAEVVGLQPPVERCYWEHLDGPVRRVVLVLVDALGYVYLRQMLDDPRAGIWRDLASRGVLLPMTAVCPSTTSTSLSTWVTGASPAEHGLLGYELWLREFGVLAEMLTMRPVYGAGDEMLIDWGLDPTRLLPVPTLSERLAPQHIATVGLVVDRYVTSPLSQALYRGVERLMGYEDVDDLWRQLRHLLETPPDRPELVLAYWGGIDTAIHLHGTGERAWQAAWASFTEAMEEGLSGLSASAREDTVMILMADHGFVDSPAEAAWDADAAGVLRDSLLIPFSGESRVAYLHAMGEKGLARLCNYLEPGFAVVGADVALRAGLFGPGHPSPEAASRLGDVVAIARERFYLDRLDRRERLRGRHGGLSPEEMLIPWLALRLDA
ncbi:MAG: alkaline phosphatase family protein [Anaerolineae bacterium]